MKKILNFILRPNMLLAAIWGRIGQGVSDKCYLSLRYWLIFGRKLHLENPKGFNEKLNWLKIFYRNPLLPQLVDKVDVKSHVASIIGVEHIIPTLGVWEKFDDIDFNSLPSQFVLKSSNGGGGTGVVVCRDKATFDKEDAKEKLEKSMRTNFRIQREWVYYNVKPRIIAEKFMQNGNDEELVDWKFMCFNGEPKLLFYASDRYTKGKKLKFDWFDINLNHLPFKSKGYENANPVIDMFPEYDEMINIARKLSQGLPHVRVDLYLINNTVYFGEMTFFHDGGAVPLVPEDWEIKIGDMLSLPQAN